MKICVFSFPFFMRKGEKIKSGHILYRADLVTVGSGASGQTTLLHRLKLDEFLTDGVDMTELYHRAYHLFQADAIYLAVFNLRVESNNLDSLTEFLNMVQSSSPPGPGHASMLAELHRCFPRIRKAVEEWMS